MILCKRSILKLMNILSIRLDIHFTDIQNMSDGLVLYKITQLFSHAIRI